MIFPYPNKPVSNSKLNLAEEQLDLAIAGELRRQGPAKELQSQPATNQWRRHQKTPTITVSDQLKNSIKKSLPTKAKRTLWVRYKVQSSGDSISVLANKYNTTSKSDSLSERFNVTTIFVLVNIY
ncbi:hypothetical protein OH492_05720 [Vibrio chagasii]|nr:hypothetical protein [Vibrio chagasii]